MLHLDFVAGLRIRKKRNGVKSLEECPYTPLKLRSGKKKIRICKVLLDDAPPQVAFWGFCQLTKFPFKRVTIY